MDDEAAILHSATSVVDTINGLPDAPTKADFGWDRLTLDGVDVSVREYAQSRYRSRFSQIPDDEKISSFNVQWIGPDWKRVAKWVAVADGWKEKLITKIIDGQKAVKEWYELLAENDRRRDERDAIEARRRNEFKALVGDEPYGRFGFSHLAGFSECFVSRYETSLPVEKLPVEKAIEMLKEIDAVVSRYIDSDRAADQRRHTPRKTPCNRSS